MVTLYFAYGSNMDRKQMGCRCPGAEHVCAASLPDYRFIINNRGYATLQFAPGAEVPGVLWRLQPSDEVALDRYEGYPAGLYDKGHRSVYDTAGNAFQALMYIDHRNGTLGAPREGYLERILVAAEEHALPERHIELLRAWPRQRTFRLFNRLVNQVKSGNETSQGAANHRDTLSQMLKQRRDELLLQALEQAAGLEEPDGLDAVLEGLVFQKLEETVECLEQERAGTLALEYFALEAFLRHIASLGREEGLCQVLSGMHSREELAGQGIIITADPERPHEKEDRFIVTGSASVLYALWRRVFNGSHGVHPRMCRFLAAFADAAECNRDDSVQQVVAEALECVHALALARRDELRLDLEAFRASISVVP